MITRLLFSLVVSAVAANAQSTPLPITLRIDYSGAEAIVGAVQRDSLTDADVDSLLKIHGVRAVIENAARYNPAASVDSFRGHIKTFVRTKSSGPGADRDFQVRYAWFNRDRIIPLINAIREQEKDVLAQTLTQLLPYAPRTGPLDITMYLVAGSPSDGFVFDDRPNAIYANVSRIIGDLDGQVSNLAHESYHVMQHAAQRRVPGLELVANAPERLPLAENLLATTLAEGTANYAIDPMRSSSVSPSMEESRGRYRRNATAERIRENFALFDSVLAGVRTTTMSWKDAYFLGFSGNNDARFYFIGYEMAKAIDKYCGAACVSGLFEKQPVEFFRQYIALYSAHPEIIGRFSVQTEQYIASLKPHSGS